MPGKDVSTMAKIKVVGGAYAIISEFTLDQLKESFNAEQMDYFKNRAKVTKALDMLWDSAKVTDAEDKAEETTEA